MHKQISNWSLLLIISSSVFLSVIDIFIVNVAIPSIQKGIHGSDGDIQLVIALYLLGYATFLIAGGRAGDYFGKKKAFITGILSFTIASVLCGISENAVQLNISRLIQGISAAIMVPQGISYIQILFPDQKSRIRALGIYGSIAGTASVIGQFLGGFLPDTTLIAEGWRLIFFINLPLGILFALLAVRYLPEHKTERAEKLDISGVVLLSLSLSGLIYPIIRGRELDWPWWSLAMICGALLLMTAFIFDQKRKLARREAPLINLEVFRYQDFTTGLFASLLYFMVQDSYFLINALLFQKGFGISSAESGMFFVLQGIGYVIASLISTALLNRYGKLVLLAGISIMICSLFFHINYFKSKDLNQNITFSIMFFYGLGCGSVLPCLLTISLKGLPSEFAGTASGTYSTFQQTAIALGIGLIGGLFFTILGDTPTLQDYVQAYKFTNISNIVLLIIVAIFVTRMQSKIGNIALNNCSKSRETEVKVCGKNKPDESVKNICN